MSEISVFAELATDFQNRYKVTRETAAQLVGVFATATALFPNEEEAQAEFTRVVTEALAAGAPWAADYFNNQVDTLYPDAALICAAAQSAGRDPSGALQAVYGIAADAATELAAHVEQRSK